MEERRKPCGRARAWSCRERRRGECGVGAGGCRRAGEGGGARRRWSTGRAKGGGRVVVCGCADRVHSGRADGRRLFVGKVEYRSRGSEPTRDGRCEGASLARGSCRSTRGGSRDGRVRVCWTEEPGGAGGAASRAAADGIDSSREGGQLPARPRAAVSRAPRPSLPPSSLSHPLALARGSSFAHAVARARPSSLSAREELDPAPAPAQGPCRRRRSFVRPRADPFLSAPFIH